MNLAVVASFDTPASLIPIFQTYAIYVGALICIISVVFAGVRARDGRMSEAMPGVSGAVFGMSLSTWGAGWIRFIHLARTTEAALLLLVVISVVLSRAETNRDENQAPATHPLKEDQL